MSNSFSREDFPIVDQWLSKIEGAVTPQAVRGEEVKCDFCEATIPPNTRFTSYLTDSLVNEDYFDKEETRPIYFLRAYCPDCDRREILDPCVGFIELLIGGELDEQRRLRSLELVDFSGRDSGVPYDPVELWNVTHQATTWEKFQTKLTEIRGHPVSLGPADIADDLRYHDVDPHEVVDHDGGIRLSDDELKQLAERF